MHQEHPEHLEYTEGHQWLSIDHEEGLATIGVTEDLVEMLPDIDTIDLPLVNDEVEVDTYAVHLHLPTRIKHLRIPLSGRIVEVNREVLDNPGLLAIKAYEYWLYRMEFDDNGELDLLMNSKQYEKYLDRM